MHFLDDHLLAHMFLFLNTILVPNCKLFNFCTYTLEVPILGFVLTREVTA